MQAEHRYGHFCTLARALEAVGERWGLLIVRDLLEGERRFTELLNSCAGIIPRQLSARLRQLESAGIVARRNGTGREVWYSLTPAGRDLQAVVDDLLLWGVEHARQPPARDEPVRGFHVLNGLRVKLEASRPPVTAPLTWAWHFPDEHYSMRFDGRHWQLSAGDDPRAEVVIKTTPRALAQIVTRSGGKRSASGRALNLQGPRSAEFRRVFGLPDA